VTSGQGNPQGKGLVPVLDAWRSTRPAQVTAKTPRQVLADYFTTLLVLSAEFGFKPVVGTPYHLYLRAGRWRLSLVSPAEWRERAPGPCLGVCTLQVDMTWALELAPEASGNPELMDALESFREGFISLLDSDATLEASLPFYVRDLPYYQRLLASGMASSLRQTLEIAGLTGTSGQAWLAGSPLPRLGQPD
jgi:hypothetical protein